MRLDLDELNARVVDGDDQIVMGLNSLITRLHDLDFRVSQLAEKQEGDRVKLVHRIMELEQGITELRGRIDL